MTRLGLGHDEDPVLTRQLAELVGLRAWDVNRAGLRKLGVIDVQNLVVKALQGTLRDGEQADRNIKIGEPEGSFGQTADMLDILLHIRPRANTPKRRNQTNGIIRFDHMRPPCAGEQRIRQGAGCKRRVSDGGRFVL